MHIYIICIYIHTYQYVHLKVPYNIFLEQRSKNAENSFLLFEFDLKGFFFYSLCKEQEMMIPQGERKKNLHSQRPCPLRNPFPLRKCFFFVGEIIHGIFGNLSMKKNDICLQKKTYFFAHMTVKAQGVGRRGGA